MFHSRDVLLEMARNREIAAKTLERLAGLRGQDSKALLAGAAAFLRQAAAYKIQAYQTVVPANG